MKKFIAALLVATAGSASATTLNFDSYANGTVLAANTFSAQGIVFDHTLTVFTYNMPGSSSPNTFHNGGYGNLSGSFVGDYANSVNFISILGGDECCDTDTVTLNAFDSLNNLLATSTFTGAASQTLTVSAMGISRFTVISSGAVTYDNLTFTAADVPEPAMLGLFGLGAIGLGLTRRRRA